MTCGSDLLPVRIIKEVKCEIAEPLSEVINKSIEQGICPENLKETKLIAIQKDKNSFKLNDLRPLAITSFFHQNYRNITTRG